MTVDRLLDTCARRGVVLWAEDGRLEVRGPAGSVTPEMEQALRHLKPALLAHLAGSPTLRSVGSARPVGVDAPRPLSVGQQGLWFLHRLEPATLPAYNICKAIDVEGQLDVARWHAAFQQVVGRHESLRSWIEVVRDLPVVRIGAQVDIPFEVVDLSAWTDTAQEAEVARRLAAEGRHVFDLGSPPLIRASLLRLGAERAVFVLNASHLVADAWSAGVFLRELQRAYAGDASPAPAYAYGDYVTWQRLRVDRGDLAGPLAWWRQRLADLPRLDLPVDASSRQAAGYDGASVPFALEPGLSARVRDLSRELGATVYSTMLATFATLLGRFSGQDDVALGTSVASRTRPELEPLVGFLANVLVLRVDLSGTPPFRELVTHVQAVAGAAFEHQDVPFDLLVKELRPERTLGVNPLFQVLFLFLQEMSGDAALTGLTLRERPFPSVTAKYDLSLHVVDDGTSLKGLLEYKTALFTRATIERLLNGWLALVEAAVLAPATRVGDLPVMDAHTRQALIAERSRAATVIPPHATLHDWFSAQAARTPDAIAVDRLTYRELDRRSARLARALRSRGVGLESRVGLMLERSADMVIAILGVLRAGGAYVPLEPGDPPARREAIRRDSGMVLLLTSIEIDDGEAEECTLPTVAGSNTAYVIYTSGSTGEPRGVLVTHGNVTRLMAATEPWFRFGPDDVWTICHSFAFDFSVWELWGPLLYGGRAVVVPLRVARSPEALARLLVDERVTVLNQTPSAFRGLVNLPHLPGATSLRHVIFGGEALDPGMLRPWVERYGDQAPRLVNMYGITETTVHVTWRPITRAEVEGGAGSVIGIPIPDLSLHVLAPNLEPVPDGVVGELHVGGEGLARGYLGRAAFTALRFVADPHATVPGRRLYRTGDLARWRNGELEFMGRADAQVKVRGFRIEPGEVEAALQRHEGVRDSVVLLREDAPGQARLVAYYIPAGEQVDPQDLRDWCGQRVPPYMVPSAFVPVPSWPRTRNDKLDRTRLPVPGLDAVARRAYVAPRTPNERALAAAWARVLGVPQVGATDDFFALGGDSILTIAVIAELRSRWLSTSVTEVYQHPKLEALAAVLVAASEDPAPVTQAFALLTEVDRARVPAGVVDAYPVTQTQAGMLFEEQNQPERAVYHDIFAFHFRVPLDESAWTRVLGAAIQRHATLRTAIDTGRFSESLQLVHGAVSTPCTFEDLSAATATEQEARIADWIEAERHRPFPYDVPPLLRFHLIRRSAETTQILLGFHHAILDGWSVASLMTELLLAYLGEIQGTPRAATDLPLAQCAESVALERAALASDESRRFWREAVTDMPDVRLPQRRATSAGTSHACTASVPVSAEVSAALEELADQAGVPLKSVLLAAHLRVLALLTGTTDVVSGLVVNGRPEGPGGDRVLGLFLNTVPLRAVLPPGSHVELVRHVFEAERRLLPHRRFPMPAVRRMTGGRALFDAAFNFTHFHVYDEIIRATGLELLGHQVIEETDLPWLAAFSVFPGTSQVALSLVYDGAQFEPGAAAVIAGYYARCLEAMATAPDASWETRDLLSAEESAELSAWGEATGVFPVSGGLYEAFAAAAARHGARVAVRGPGGSLTYAALTARATALAVQLRAVGVGPETRVGLCVARSVDLVVAIVGILQAGGVYVPLDPALPTERLRFQAADSALTLVVTDATHAATVAALGLTGVRVDEPGPAAAPAAAACPAATPSQAAYVIYTSGSTGTPKGVVVTHGNVRRLLASTEAAFGFDEHDVWTLFHSYAFDFSVWELWGALLYGGAVVVVPYAISRTPDQFLALLADEGVTVLNQTPSAFAQLQAVDDGRPLALRYVIFGGEALDLPRLQPWFARRGDTTPQLVNMYGITETTVHVTYRALTAADATRASSVIGRALPDLSVAVLDPAGLPVPIGVPGELYVGGAGVARGYHARDALTAERFVERPDGRVYRSGDLVRWLPTGELEYLGRIDQQVKIRGFRIELGEIEHVLRTAAGVADVAVLARAGGETPRLVAYVVPGASTPTPAALRAWCEARLPDYMVPSAYVLLGALPLTGNGKLDRAALPAPDADALPVADYVAPHTETERALAAIWREVLQVDRVGRHDNFFALGGDSILLLQVASRCARAGLAVTRRQLIEHQSIAELSTIVTRVDAVVPSSASPLPATMDEGQPAWPLTPLQEGLLFHAVSQPDESVYLEQLHCTLDGDLNLFAFERAWQDAIASHDVLRAGFMWSDGQPRQHVEPEVAFAVVSHDWRTIEPAEQDARFSHLLAEDRRLGFDLAHPPLMRVTLLRVADRRWRWLWTHHHLILDGWSVSQLVGEVLERYRAAVTGSAPALVERRPFRDLLAWVARQDKAAAEAYWREALDGFHTPSRLVVPRPATPDGGSPEQDLVLPATLHTRLQAWSRQAQVTPSTIVTAAWASLIRAYAGTDDVVFGVTVAGRPAELDGYDRMIGPFINTLPLRVRLNPSTSFQEWLRALHLDHARMREFEYSRLVDIQRWSGVPPGTPLFDALMVFENYPVDASLREHQSGLAFGPVTFVERSTYGLALAAIPADTLTLRMHFDPSRVDRATVVRMLDQLATLLERAASGAVTVLGDWSIVSAEERARLTSWSATSSPDDLTRPVHALFAEHADLEPDRPAVVFGDHQVSYGELARGTDRLAARLRAAGAGPEVLVGVRIERSVEMVAAILAIWKAGAAYLPLDPSYPERRLAQMTHESGVRLVVTESIVRAAMVGDAGVSGSAEECPSPVGAAALDNLAYVIYTSGSTGTPKGAQLTHRGLINLALVQSRAFDVRAGDRVLLFASINFDASVSEVAVAFASGATLYVASRDEILPGQPFVELLREQRITCLTIPPSVLSAVPFADLPDLRTLVVAGEACPPALAAQWSEGRRFINAYGPTENTVCATLGGYDGVSLTIGRPMAQVRIHILDDCGEPVPAGVAGEIHIGGIGVARGYLGRPGLTAERFVPDPWSSELGARMYRSGDLARWRDDGTIEYLGRIDQQVKVRGHRIEPEEIAHVLRDRGGVADAAVLVVTAASGQPRLVAYVAARGRALASDALQATCAEWLPDYMVPSTIVVLDDLPLTPSGKVDRAALPDPDESLRAGFRAPRTPTEVVLAGVWREVLGVERVGVDDNFFALGGDSIVTLQVVSRAAREGVHVTPRDLFRHPTVAALAAVCRAAASAASRRLPPGTPVPLTPIQRWFFDQPLVRRERWNQAVLLEVAPSVDADALEDALRAVGRRHDALRTRFTRQETGWTQVIGDGDGFEVERVLDGRLAEHAERAHASLRLDRGPLARALHFAPEHRLLVVIHHLAVDGVSWRVLLDEVEQVLEGASLEPATQFAEWALRLERHAAEGTLDVHYWRRLAVEEVQAPGALARVSAAVSDTRGRTARVVEARLTEEETETLLRRVPTVHQTRVNDALLAAVGAAMRDVVGTGSVWLDLEGHGREPLFDDVDLASAVGWFTSLFPVRLEAAATEPRRLLQSVREQLKHVPRNGVEFGIARHLRADADLQTLPEPEISFNYLGQLDQGASRGRFTLVDGPVGDGQVGDEWRQHRLDVVASVRGGAFRVEWHYADGDCDTAQVEALAASYVGWLRRLIRATRAVTESPDVEDVYGLTPMQQGLLFHALEARDTSLYIEQLHGELRGRLNPEAFERAWQAVVRRHAIFRTGFVWDGAGEPLQHVRREVDFHLDRHDWRSIPADQQSERLATFLEDDRRRGFSLDRAPLLRVALVQLTNERWHWVWTHHHLLLDGWCLAPVVSEVLQVYEGFAAGGAPPTLPTRRPYRAYIDWLAAQDGARAERYWRTTLAGVVSPTRLRLAPGPDAESSGQWQLALTDDETARLHAWARLHNLTVNTVVTAAWARVLQAFSGNQDVVFGVTVSGRPADLAGSGEMIGLFINTLPLRVGSGRGRTLVDWLHDLQRQQADQRQFEYSRLVDVQRWSDLPPGEPLFDTLLAFDNYPVDRTLERRFGDLEVHDARLVERTHYPLSLSVVPADRLRVRALWDPQRIPDTGVRRMLGALRTLLVAVASDRVTRVDAWSLVDAEESAALLARAGTGPTLPEAGTGTTAECLHDWFSRVARSRGDAVAISCEAETITYAALEARSNQLANLLRARGVGVETLVGLRLERSVDLIVGLLGILKSGGAYVPFDPANPPERTAFMLADSGVREVVTADTFRDEAFISASTTRPASGAGPDAAAYVIYTSGSTGQPKGCVVAHRNVHRLMRQTEAWFGFGSADVWTLFHSVAFDFSVWEIWGALLYGGRLVVVPYTVSRTPDEFLELVAREEVTVLNQTPSAFRQFMAADEKLARPLALRSVIFGGEALQIDALAPWFERHGDARPQLVNMYGITETTVHVTYRVITRADLASGTGSRIGVPIPDLQLYVLDAHQQLVPEGVAGELYVAGAGLARGYLRRARLTAERMIPNPFGPGRLYRTGDLVRWRDDGLEYLGRVDDQVKLRGFRIELGEIESVLATHPAVQEVAVLLRDERLVAYVVPRAGAERPTEDGALAAALRAHATPHLPDYMLPGAFVVLDQMPLTGNGKLHRAALPAPDPLASAAYTAPRTDRERTLAEVWRDVLGAPAVGIHDNFFALGGDSIRSIQVIALARERGITLTFRDLFERPTIAELSAEVSGEPEVVTAPFELVTAETRARLPADVEDAYPLTRLQQGMLFHGEAYHDVMSYRLRAPLDVPAFRAALDVLTGRHAILRTSVDLSSHGEPMQLVHRASTIALEVNVDEWVTQERARGFDLEQAPLLRAHVRPLGDGTFRLEVGFHHAILDGWSLASMLAELFREYLLRVGGPVEPALPAPEACFRDYVALERRAIGDAGARAFWREFLADAVPALLPRRLAPAGRRIVRHPITISDETSHGLKRLADEAGVPLRSALLAAHMRALALFTGVDDVVTGLVTNGRPERLGGDRVLGLFLNTVPFRQRLRTGTWRELVEDTFRTEQRVSPYRRFPMPEVQKMRGGAPLFETDFNFVHFHVYDQLRRFDDVEVLEAEAVEETNFTLAVNFSWWGNPARLSGSLDYDAGVLDDGLMAQYERAFSAVLEAMALDPHEAWTSRPLVVPFVDDETAAPESVAAPQRLHDLVSGPGPSVAVMAGAEVLTYTDLHRRAGRLAHALRARGVGPDVVVGVALEPCAARVVALLGILQAGGAYLPIDTDLPPQRVELMLRDSGARHVVARPGFACDAEIIDVSTAGHGLPDTPPSVDVEPGNTAYVIYTSGSTGHPKGVLVTHSAIVNHMRWMHQAYPLTPADRVFQKTPIGFDASVWEFWAPLMAGAVLVVGRAGGHQDPAYLVEIMRSQGVTILQAVPTLLGVLADEPGVSDCRSLRRVFAGGEALMPSLARRLREVLPQAELVNLYGPTEAAIDATAHRVDVWNEVVPIGKPIHRMGARVLDAWLQPVPDGTDGELYLAGAGVARGYLGQSALTASHFVADPWSRDSGGRMYRTGDVVCRRSDGVLEFRRRADDQVKVRGQRIELGEVEAVLASHPAVRQAAASVIDGRLVAYVTGEQADDLRSFIADRLPSAMVPSVFLHLDVLPLTTSGKVDRRALPTPDAPVLGRGPYVEPSTAAEQALAYAWQSVLGVEKASAADDFFDAGGDSILSLQIVARLRAAGWKLAPRDLLEHQSIVRVASRMRPLMAAAPNERPTGPVPLLPIQRRFFAHPVARRHHWNQSTFVSVPDDFDMDRFSLALQSVVSHHDAFRLRFQQVDGDWQQAYADVTGPVPCERLTADDLEAAIDRVQAGLNITDGPVLRAAFFEDQRRLLIVAHHLVVDAVSWRILLDDLTAAYAGRPLVASTTSLRTWSERLQAITPSLSYWAPLSGRTMPRLPVTAPSGPNTESDARSLVVSLDIPDLIGARVSDVLLGALGDALREWSGCDEVWVDVEAHGRDDLFDDVDLSRTVGWFTTIFPVALTAGRVVMPERGIDYGLVPDPLPRREVSFNYLGRVETSVAGGFSAAPERAGFDRAPENERQYLLDVSAKLEATRLGVEFTYAGSRLEAEAIARVAEAFTGAVRRRLASGAEDELPLAPLQAGFLYHALDDSGDGAYIQQLSVTLDGVPRPGAFQRAWDRVLARHAALRVWFRRDDTSTPTQVVASRVHCPITWLDWRGRSDDAWASLLAADRALGFDLSVAPLMRVTVVRTGDATCRLLWSHHHLILDGWSLPIVMRDLLAYYREEAEGVEAALPPTPDYTTCLRRLVRTDRVEEEAYWRDAIGSFSEPNQIALPVPAAADGSEPYAELAFALTTALTADLAALAQRARVTLNTVVQALWALTVGTYSSRRDVVFGVTVSGRAVEVPGIEQLAGLFINTLPLRVDTGAGRTVVELLRYVQARQGRMSRHESSPLVDVHGWSGVPRTSPLFETILVFENYPLGESLGERPLRDFAVRNVHTSERTHYPLTCYAVPGDRLRLTLVYRTDQFADASIRGMRDYLSELAEALVRGERRPRRVASTALRGGIDIGDDGRPVHERVQALALREPGRRAVVCGSTTLTYGELEGRSEALAARLRQAGVRPGRIVGVSMERSADLVVALLGVLKAGGAYLPLDQRFPQERLRMMAEDARPVLTLTSLDVPDVPAAREEAHAGAASLDDLAYVIYTSGSTGRPKGVEIPHRALANALASFARQPGLTAPDVMLAITTISFDIAALELFLPLIVGATLVVATAEEATDADRLSALLAAHRATVLQATPATWRMLLTAGWRPAPGLRMWCGGEAMPVDLASALTVGGAELWNLYGPTETTIWSAVGRVSSPDAAKWLGPPIANTTLLVVDDQLQPVPDGVPGELLIGGDGVGRGYHGQPALTAARFVADELASRPGARAYRTGDRVRVDLDGRLEFLGRIDAQVKVRGFRVELGEIEAALRRDPDVRDAAVTVVDGQRLAAFVVLDGARRPTLATDLAASLREQLPEYMVPGFFTDVPALPLTPNGKLDRRALGSWSLPAPESTYLAPRDAVEAVLADLWRQVLGVERVGVRDDFFALGGHSLHVAQIVAWVRQAFRVSLPLRSVFESLTVERFATVLTGLESQVGRTQQVAAALQRLQAMTPEERARLRAARRERAGEVQ